MRLVMSLTKKISSFLRGTLYALRSLVGIRPKEGGFDYSAPAAAIWVFIVGIPVGMLLFGSETFMVSIWFTIVLGMLILMNLDDTVQMISNFISYGVDGVIVDKVVEMYEEPANV